MAKFVQTRKENKSPKCSMTDLELLVDRSAESSNKFRIGDI